MGAFRVQKQPWMLIDRIPVDFVRGSTAGILGLAWESLAATGATPFWQTLADSGTLAAPEMSFWFTRLISDSRTPGEEFGGTFTLGGRNKTLYTGDVEFLPLITFSGQKTWWFLEVTGAHLIRLRLVPDSSSLTSLDLRDHRQRK